MEKLSRSPAWSWASSIAVLSLTLLECAPSDVTRAEAPLDPPLTGARPALAFAVAPPDPGAPASSQACPEEMILVDGMYCPNVKQTCIRWVDPPTDAFAFTRCAEWKKPATCEGRREKRRFCVDREEFVQPPEIVPMAHVNWTDAQALCAEKGARLCTESEWQFACEGEEMRPYPYGWVRDKTLCNFDRTDLGKAEEGLTDHRFPPDAFPECVSPFGVHDMVGNVDEWTARDGQIAPHRSALHGGWWLPGRNNCRQATLGHTEDYLGPQVGFRCCRDALAP